MLVKDVMTTHLRALPADRSIRQAAEAMKAKDIGLLPVVSDRRDVLGVVTDRDIVIRAVAAGLDSSSTPIRQILTEPVFWCRVCDSVEDVGALMAEMGLRRLLVKDTNGHPAGVVTLGDLATRLADARAAGETLAGIRRAARPVEPDDAPIKLAPAAPPTLADPEGTAGAQANRDTLEKGATR